jgi:multiple sugar transport system substrate-binding protein
LVDNGDAKRDAGAKFVEFVITEETLDSYLKNITPAYPAKYSMEKMDSVTNNEILKGAAAAAGRVKAIAFIPEISDLNLELCALAQAVTVGNENVDAAIAKFKATAQMKLNK